MFTITKRFEFEAAHFLTRVPEHHKCRRLHGHNYVVTVELAAETLDEKGFVVDYGDLNAFAHHLDATYDHRCLNDVMEYETTAEHLAVEFFDWCAKRWEQTKSVRVEETRGTSAEYRP